MVGITIRKVALETEEPDRFFEYGLACIIVFSTGQSLCQ